VSNRTRVAVLMTCHNRKEQTLACLAALYGQALPAETEIASYLVDDGSSDGTGAAVRALYPQVVVLDGDGNLFWNRGMHWAFAEALKGSYSYYLWLNSDTELAAGALRVLLHTHRALVDAGRPLSLVVGSTRDRVTGCHTYGGQRRTTSWHPFRLVLVPPGNVPLRVDTMNGNCVLIHSEVTSRVGNLDPIFSHAMGDTDYGFRATRMGCSVWAAPGYLAECTANSLAGSWYDPTVPLRARWRMVRQEKGLPPRDWRRLCRRHAGLAWALFFCAPYIKLILSSCITCVSRGLSRRAGTGAGEGS
jgi:GT2 family glycosyltransferase